MMNLFTEIPFSLDDLKREDFRLTSDQFKINIFGAGYIDKNLEARYNSSCHSRSVDTP
jgi:hypothetical protein